MSKHTPEPWTADGKKIFHCYDPVAEDLGYDCTILIGSFNDEEDAKRTIECVSACEDIADPSAIPELVKFLKTVLEPARLRDLSKLASNPPQNGAVWDLRAIASKLVARVEGKRSE